MSAAPTINKTSDLNGYLTAFIDPAWRSVEEWKSSPSLEVNEDGSLAAQPLPFR
jgi:hypothetical protein